MKISRIALQFLPLPGSRTVGLPIAGRPTSEVRSARQVLVATVETNASLIGTGIADATTTGTSLLAGVEGLTALVVGEHALHHERLWAKILSADNPILTRLYSAIDVALWDLKAKAAGVPLWRLLGGVRESARGFNGDTADTCGNADEILTIAREGMKYGLAGVRVSVRGINPETDSQSIVSVRDALGEDQWFAVSVENPFDYETALPMARFLEEEVGADWFEDPLSGDDLAGYSRLASRTDTPLATGSRYSTIGQFLRVIESGAPITLRPDLTRLGGLTPILKIATLGETVRRPVVPRLPTEIGIHLACGLPGISVVEYSSALSSSLRTPLAVSDGFIIPPSTPGLGLDLDDKAISRLTAE